MPDPSASPARPHRRPEGWFGVLMTALLCGIFLWWWFLPEPVSSETERDPLHWVGQARARQGAGEPTLAMRFEIIMIAEALRQRGEAAVADRLERDWLPPEWPATAPADSSVAPATPIGETPDPEATAASGTTDEEAGAAGSGEPDPVAARLEAAAAAFDTLDIEGGQQVLREAAEAAAALPEPARTQALWRVAARQARSGLAADAAVTRQYQPAPAGGPDFPDGLIAEMFASDLLAPVMDAHATLPAAHPRTVALAGRWRALVRERLAHRDHPLLTRHGPATDASDPARETDATPSLWAAVEANRLGEAARLAGDDPAASLAVARLLTWLAAPPP